MVKEKSVFLNEIFIHMIYIYMVFVHSILKIGSTMSFVTQTLFYTIKWKNEWKCKNEINWKFCDPCVTSVHYITYSQYSFWNKDVERILLMFWFFFYCNIPNQGLRRLSLSYILYYILVLFYALIEIKCTSKTAFVLKMFDTSVICYCYCFLQGHICWSILKIQ